MSTLNENLKECEQELFEELIAVILFLNSNGVPIKTVKEMLKGLTERAFIKYKNDNILERFKDDIRHPRGFKNE